MMKCLEKLTLSLGFRLSPLLLLISVFLSSSPFAYSQSVLAPPVYYNADLGIRVTFKKEWDVFTSYDEAPLAIKPNFSADKESNDSPLFFAVHENQQLFSRLLMEDFSGDLERYAVLLGQGISEQGLEMLSAKMSVDNSSVELVYQYAELGLVFTERASLLEDGHVIRMAVWSSLAASNSLQRELESLFAGAELVGVAGGTNGWFSYWGGLQDRLSSQEISGISVSAEFNSDQLYCEDSTATMLWQVETDVGSGVEIFLYGSIHLGKADFYPLASPIENSFRQSDFIVFEVDPETASDPAIAQEIQARGLLPQGQTLNNFVSQQSMLMLNRVLGDAGVSSEPFLRMKPWLATIVLSTLQITSLGYSPEFGVENYLMEQKPSGVDVLELESIETQVAFLEELNHEVYLKYTLASFEEGKEKSEELIQAWRCADKEALTLMLFDEFENDVDALPEERLALEQLKEKIFFERNINMSKGVQSFIEEGVKGSYFVVVGSGHLLGERSVIDLLKQQGYSVKPILK